MSNEIGVTGLATGLTLYATIRDSTNQVWNGSAFEAQVQANLLTYAVTMTENGTTGTYLGTFPATAAGVYSLTVRSRAGGSPAWTDPVVASEPAYQWSGTAAVSLSSRMATYAQPTGFLAATFPSAVGTSTYAGGAVASVTGTVNATLVATGLDAISVTPAAGVPATFREMMVGVYRRFFKKSTRNLSTAEIKMFADDETTVLLTQSSTDDGTVQTQGAAS